MGERYLVLVVETSGESCLAAMASLGALVWAVGASAGGGEAVQLAEGLEAPPESSGDDLYCQTPEPFGSVNASTGWSSKVADDIPLVLSGQTFNQVTIWVAEWQIPDESHWVDPDAVWVRLYDGTCPPPDDAFAEYRVPWADVETMLWWPGNPWVVYEARVPLPEPVTLPFAATSIGFQIENSWGSAVPHSGVMFVRNGSHGACRFWFTLPPENPVCTEVTEDWDLGFCLGYRTTTSIPDEPFVHPVSWGRLKTKQR